MNLKIEGHHVSVTPALREYVLQKLDRVTRHFDQVVDVSVKLTYEKHKDPKSCNVVEVDLHVKDRDIHVAHRNGDMYETIDAVMHKLDRQVCRHKERVEWPRHKRAGREFADSQIGETHPNFADA